MSVTAEVETRSRTNVLSVPIQCVTTRLPKEPPASSKPTNAVAKTQAKSSSGANAATAAEASKPDQKATNAVTAARKPNEPPKPVEVVFLADKDKVKMVKVTRGISDDSYVEITEGLTEGQEVVSGGYKAINTLLEDGKTIKVDNNKKSLDKSDKKEEPGK